MLKDLRPDTQRQGILFDAAPDRARLVRAKAALDALNDRFGRDTVHLGSAGLVRRAALHHQLVRASESAGEVNK